MLFFGASSVVAGVVAVVERPTRSLFFGALAFFCLVPFLAMRFGDFVAAVQSCRSKTWLIFKSD